MTSCPICTKLKMSHECTGIFLWRNWRQGSSRYKTSNTGAKKKSHSLECRSRHMADVFSRKKRSWVMSKIRCKNTSPELAVRSILHQEGFRFRLHVKGLPGKPDIVLPKYRTVIFVHGCFWHHPARCKNAIFP